MLHSTHAVRNLIREGKTHQLPSVIQTNRKLGMITMDDAIQQLYLENQIKEYQTKILRCNNEISESKREIEFNEELIKSKEEQIQKLIKDNELSEVDKAKFAEEIKEIEVKAVALEDKIKQLGEKLIELQKQRDLVQEELLNAETQKNKISNEIEKIGEQVESFKTRRKELEPELEEIREELKQNDIDTLTDEEVFGLK